MSPSTLTRAGRGRCGSRSRLRSSGVSRRSWFGFSEDSGLQPIQFRLLIDENLSPRLVGFARRRGFPTVHVNQVNLRTAPDKHIARYAVENGLILVTNNMGDFKRLYSRRKLHPGVVFLQCTAKVRFTERHQLTLLDAVLDDILLNDLVQEAILIDLMEFTDASLHWDLTRQPLPAS